MFLSAAVGGLREGQQWEDESAWRSRKSGAAHGCKLRSGPGMLALRVWDEWEGSRQVGVHPLGSQRSDKATGILVFPGATQHRRVRCVRYKPQIPQN